ncbi:hypothetical protein [Clostridium perfringens]|uniref:hypothetical protein n=1 Tax=Clostridium perfringens TaxID=1502 RepID=UPI002245265A|nr:hypothetical protein [Clostridium perfringens]MCX0411296.1 hypothetical protein [Clostridium perfringens]
MKDLKFEELEIIEGGNAAQKILGGVGLVAAGVGAACALPAIGAAATVGIVGSVIGGQILGATGVAEALS